MRLIPLLFILALTVHFPTSHSFAATVVGTVKHLRGSAIAVRDAKNITLKVGDPIFEGDLIKTGKRSSIYAAMDGSNKSAIRMGQKSQLQIEEYRLSAGQVIGGLLKGLVGIFSVELNNLRHGSSFNMHTPTAVLGVRGTIWGTIVKSDGSSTFAVKHGVVDVKIGDKLVVLKRGQTVNIAKTGLVSPIQATPKSLQDTLDSDGSNFDNAKAEAAALEAALAEAKKAAKALAQAAEKAVNSAKAAKEAEAIAAANPEDTAAAALAKSLRIIADKDAEAVVLAAQVAVTTKNDAQLASTILNFATSGTAVIDIPATNTSLDRTETNNPSAANTPAPTTGATITPTTTTPGGATTTGGGVPASPA